MVLQTSPIATSTKPHSLARLFWLFLLLPLLPIIHHASLFHPLLLFRLLLLRFLRKRRRVDEYDNSSKRPRLSEWITRELRNATEQRCAIQRRFFHHESLGRRSETECCTRLCCRRDGNGREEEEIDSGLVSGVFLGGYFFSLRSFLTVVVVVL